MSNVWVKSGRVLDLIPSTTTGVLTGSWMFKDSPYSAIQAIVTGTGVVGATITIEVSNDGVNSVSTALGVITVSGTTAASDGFTTEAPWKYIRAVVSSPSGTISGISVLMGV